eukprot:12721-Heterococcus_DN1.PRE.2
MRTAGVPGNSWSVHLSTGRGAAREERLGARTSQGSSGSGVGALGSSAIHFSRPSVLSASAGSMPACMLLAQSTCNRCHTELRNVQHCAEESMCITTLSSHTRYPTLVQQC